MEEPHSQSNSPSRSSHKSLNSILLIEDDEITNFFHSHLIKKTGMAQHVHVEMNGRLALRYLLEKDEFSPDYQPPDLILLDINMPIMNGFEFLEAYSQLHSDHGKAPVILMLTSSLLDVDRNRALQFDCLADYYTKPLNEDKLREILERYFD